MHEFALAVSIRDIALDAGRAHAALRVKAVRCRIGVMRQVVPALLDTAFEAACAGTIAAGATLVLEVEPLTVTCRACGAVGRAMEMVFACPACDSADVRIEGGGAMTVESIDIDQEDDDGDCRAAQRAGAQRRDGR